MVLLYPLPMLRIACIYEVDKANHIPQYYKKYIDAKTRVINNLQKSQDSFSFIFITDMHIQHNTKHSVPLIKHLISKCGIKDVLGGGDWITAWLSDADGKQGLKDDYDELTKLYDGIPLIKTVGNQTGRGGHIISLSLPNWSCTTGIIKMTY